MSVRCTAWAWSVADTVPSSPGLLVLLKLADMAWDNGKVWPSHAYVAKGTKLSTRTVRSAVEALEREGFLRTEPRPGRTDVIWLAVTARIEFDDVPENGEFEGGMGRGRPRKETPPNRDKTPAGDADESLEPESKDDVVGLRTPEPFDVWWSAYPRKVAKLDARKAWRAVPAKIGLEDLMELTRRFADHVVGKDPEHVAHPATWLNGERWTDELPDRSQTDGQLARPTGGIDRAAERADARVQAMVDGARQALTGGRRRWTLPGA